MKLYYSGANQPNTPQNDPKKSLGGYLSSTEVPNGRLNNIFNDISPVSKQFNYEEVKGVFIKNTTGAAVNNVTVYSTEGTNTDFKIQLSATTAANFKMEQIGSSKDTPLYGDFYNVGINYSKSLCTITGTLTPNTDVIIAGRYVTVGSTSDNDAFIQNAINVFSTDSTLQIVKVNSTKFYIVYREIGNYTQNPGVISENTVITSTNYSGGEDNSVLISNSLANNGYIALWLKKIIKPGAGLTDEELYAAFKANNFNPVQNQTPISTVNLTIQWD